MIKKLFTFLFASIISVVALAQDFDPASKSIEIVCAYPPGGASDKVARVIEQIMTKNGWKAHVINKPGADTVIAANYAAKAAADGYTLYMGGNGFLDSNIAFKNKAPGIEYTESSFVPVMPMGISTLVLAVPGNSPINTYEDLVKYVKANPNKFNVGFWNQYIGNLFKLWAKLENLPQPTIVNYKGSAPQMVDLMGGNLEFAFDTFVSTKQPWQTNKIKIIATLTKEGEYLVRKTNPKANVTVLGARHPELDMNIWYGLYAPAGTDAKVINKINSVINKALADQSYAEQLLASEIINSGGSVEKLRGIQTKTLNIMRTVSRELE